jgi:phospholipid/cholesterol/gamma-HCH transport system substrate-binding protein
MTRERGGDRHDEAHGDPGVVTHLTDPRTNPPFKSAGAVLLVVLTAVTAAVYLQFRGEFTPTTRLTAVAPRAGLVMNPGSKVTYNGVAIGRVDRVDAVMLDSRPRARITLDIRSKYLSLIPKNVAGAITDTTLFGNKYISLSSPDNPVPQRISGSDVIDLTAVTTEFNTLFETVVSIAEQVDPIKLNQTLAAAAEALDGSGQRFGRSLDDGNAILADLNERVPQIRYDIERFADLGEEYAAVSPDLFAGLDDTARTAQTLNEQQAGLDRALLAAIGVGSTGADITERGGPYLARIAHDLTPTSQVLDRNSPALFCTVRNFHDVEPKFANALGGNGYSGTGVSPIMGAGNPYVYPDNLPRVNARGGPEGRPGCWQKVTRELWPMPYLVMDTGASIAPYNHLELGQPILIEYVWGRQIGENTINP